MSICLSGITDKVCQQSITIEINEKHPLVRLANALPWEELTDLVMVDLKASTAKKKWWTGRPLRLRIHLGAYLLQQIFNKTDRQIEYDIKDNAAYQLFCGREIVKKWHCPDHTKIEEFRSRLTSETQRQCANHLAMVASRLGFANPDRMDIDSTVQEANMSYPSDMNLLGKLTAKAKRVRDYVVTKSSTLMEPLPEIDLKTVKSKIRNLFFKKKITIEEKRSLQRSLWRTVCSEVKPVVRWCEQLAEEISQLPWNIQRAINQIKNDAKIFLMDIAFFIRHGEMQPGKLLAFHLKEVSCFNKNKPDKRLQFGRNIQLGRIDGNFLIVGPAETVRQEDKKSIQPMLALHDTLFGEQTLDSITADKGYYSKKNEQLIKDHHVKESGLQKPQQNRKIIRQQELSEDLINRRAGIEPLIAHAKQKGQLGKSRMKSDGTTKASAFTSILGFNARQLVRYLNEATSLG
jgi:IS5 family transposase